MAKRKDPAAVALGRRGGKAAAGRGGRKYWSEVPAEERTKIMRRVAEHRWTKAKKGRSVA